MVVVWMKNLVEIILMVKSFLLIESYYQCAYMILYYNRFEHHARLIYVSKSIKEKDKY